jgi:hypothetical protein
VLLFDTLQCVWVEVDAVIRKAAKQRGQSLA